MLPYNRNHFSSQQIADSVGLTRQHVVNRIMKHPDFPKFVKVISRKTKFCNAEEIAHYFKRK